MHNLFSRRRGTTPFESIIQQTPVPMSVVRGDGHVVGINPAYCAVLGRTPDELTDIRALIHPDDAGLMLQLFGELTSGKRTRYEITRRARTASGGVAWLQTTAFLVDGFQVEVAHDITAQRRMEADLRATEAQLATHHAIIHLLAEAQSLDEAIQRFLKSICEHEGWQVGAFWSVDRRSQVLRCSHVWHLDEVRVPQFETVTRSSALAPGDGLPGRVWRSGDPAWTQNFGIEDTVLRGLKAEAEGLRSAFCLPIVFEGQVQGIIELLSSDLREPDKTLMSASKTIGGLVGRFFERERADETLKSSEERYRTITELAHDAVITIDEGSRILSVNASAERIFGYERDELLGHSLTMLMPPNVRDAHKAGVGQYISTGKRRIRWDALEVTGMRKDGKEILMEVSLAEFSQNGKRTFTGYLRDITERKQEESALVYQALHDSLTDLPNRRLLLERLQQAILVAHRHSTPIALLLMDLDRFKDVNDTFGPHSGDLLLQQVGQRLLGTMRESDTVARLGGDEFAVLLPTTAEGGAKQAATRILDALGTPFTLEGRQLDVGVSIGISLYPEHGAEATELMRRADVAMYVAKRGAGGFSVYSSDRDEHNSQRLLLTTELRNAIEGNQLILHYQPKLGLTDGSTRNVEALVRWMHPERGFTPPDMFIPLAEETGLVKPLTLWVLNESLRQHQVWREIGFDIRMAVNFSARTLHEPDLVRTVTDLLKNWDVEPSRLEIEITESAIMLDPDRAMRTLTELHDAGIWTSIDDFGTGYSSLGYLRKLPVDEIKIDKSFVLDMATSRDDASIVRSIITLGHNLGLQVVAEGVDNRRTLDMLTDMGCDLAQGFFLSRPVAAAELTEWLNGPKPRLSVVS